MNSKMNFKIRLGRADLATLVAYPLGLVEVNSVHVML